MGRVGRLAQLVILSSLVACSSTPRPAAPPQEGKTARSSSTSPPPEPKTRNVDVAPPLKRATVKEISLAKGEAPPPPGSLRVTPNEVELGPIGHCNAPPTQRIALINTLEVPLRIVEWKSTCGCTAPIGIVPGSVLAPRERKEIELRVDPYGRGLKRQRIDFLGESRTLLGSILIDYEIISPVRAEPSAFVRSRGEDSTVALVVDDNTPFRILSSDPPVVSVVGNDESTFMTIALDWKALDAFMQRSQAQPVAKAKDAAATPSWRTTVIKIKTDREDCPMLYVPVKNLGGEGSLAR